MNHVDPAFPTDEDVALMAWCCDRWWPRFHRLFAGDCSVYGGDQSTAARAILAYLAASGVKDSDTVDRVVRASGLSCHESAGAAWPARVGRDALAA